MKKGCNYPGLEGAADNMNPETILSLKEDCQRFTWQHPPRFLLSKITGFLLNRLSKTAFLF